MISGRKVPVGDQTHIFVNNFDLQLAVSAKIEKVILIVNVIEERISQHEVEMIDENS